MTASGSHDFEHALALHQAGQMAAAGIAYAGILQADPQCTATLIHFGALRLAEGRAADAETLLRRAVGISPSSAEAAANLATALQALGRHDDAVVEYQRALTLRSDLIEARFALAACLQVCGRETAAMQSYELVLAAAPHHPEACYGLAGLLARRDMTEQAIGLYRTALDADPDFAEASLALGNLLAQTGNQAEAEACFRQALDVDPDYLQAHLALATLLNRDRRSAAAVPHFRAVLAADPQRADARAGLAEALKSTGQHGEALAIARQLAVSKPQCASTAALLGSILAEVGAMAEARQQLRRAVTLAPERAELSYHLLQLAKAERGDQAIAALERRLADAALPPRERCLVYFGLAKAYDDLGERDRGFDYLLRGNALKRAETPYDEATVLAAMKNLERVFTPELFAKHASAGDPSPIPVFIVGMPRSGTTLVEQILASHPDMFGAGEQPELSRVLSASGAQPDTLAGLHHAELRAMGANYLAALRPLAPDAARIIDKMPINFLHVGLIRLILPGARIIHCRRDPVDTCLSCFSKLFAGDQPFTYDLAELGRFYHAYRRLLAHWRQVLPAGVMLDIDYEELVGDVESQARLLVAHCGLPWDAACLAFDQNDRAVHTASFAQVRQPIYRSSIGRWRPSADLLLPLLEGLKTGTPPPDTPSADAKPHQPTRPPPHTPPMAHTYRPGSDPQTRCRPA